MDGIRQVDWLKQLGGVGAVSPVDGVDTSAASAETYAKYNNLTRELFDLKASGLTDAESLEKLQEMGAGGGEKKAEAAKTQFDDKAAPKAAAPAINQDANATQNAVGRKCAKCHNCGKCAGTAAANNGVKQA